MHAAPVLAAHLAADVRSWDDVKLLTVAVDRLTRWSKPGLLCIGDAAHAMSPIGDVGINLAILDAVAAANLLAVKLRAGTVTDDDLDAVRRRRLWPTKATQAMQITMQDNVLVPVMAGANAALEVPLPMRVITAVPMRSACSRACPARAFAPSTCDRRWRDRPTARAARECRVSVALTRSPLPPARRAAPGVPRRRQRSCGRPAAASMRGRSPAGR